MKIIDIIKANKAQKASIKGWVTSNRGNNKIRFITINDGSNFEGIQAVVKTNAEALDQLRLGSAIEVDGDVVLTPDAKQKCELVVLNFKVLALTDEDYPIQKKSVSKEFLREVPHLRHRTNTFRAIMRIRSTLMQEIHAFFAKENFLLVSTPIITSNDGEGAGEAFVVDSEDGGFFGKKATLGVTGQLQGESYANGFGDIYTFGPTFRAEESHTQKHISEFWMLEPEMAFYDKFMTIDLADKMLKSVIENVLIKHPQEFAFLNEAAENKDLISGLKAFIQTPLKKMSYQEAIDILQKNKDKFEVKEIEFGLDLGTEHEKFLAQNHAKGPVAVYDYPKEIKAFYMKLNADKKTVGGFDILVPGIGELVGGSERETDYQKILEQVKNKGIDVEDIQWYLDLRRFGHFQSAGFGLGFERFVMFVTGVSNIRDTIPYPRTPKNLRM